MGTRNLPNIGDHVWLITSRHTEPLLARILWVSPDWLQGGRWPTVHQCWGGRSYSWSRCLVIWKGTGQEVQRESSTRPRRTVLRKAKTQHKCLYATESDNDVHTFCRTMEKDVELLHIIVHERYLVIWHQPSRGVRNAIHDFWTGRTSSWHLSRCASCWD